MKRYQKIYLLMLFLFLSGRIEFSSAQSGASCNDALPVSFSPGVFQDVSFNNQDFQWLTIQPDTPDAVLEFFPDAVSEFANIESIDLYSGNDCASKMMIWSQQYTDADSL